MANTLLHFASGFIGKGHRGDMPRWDLAAADQPGDLARDDARLAATGASENEQRAIDVADSRLLLRI